MEAGDENGVCRNRQSGADFRVIQESNGKACVDVASMASAGSAIESSGVRVVFCSAAVATEKDCRGELRYVETHAFQGTGG